MKKYLLHVHDKAFTGTFVFSRKTLSMICLFLQKIKSPEVHACNWKSWHKYNCSANGHFHCQL